MPKSGIPLKVLSFFHSGLPKLTFLIQPSSLQHSAVYLFGSLEAHHASYKVPALSELTDSSMIPAECLINWLEYSSNICSENISSFLTSSDNFPLGPPTGQIHRVLAPEKTETLAFYELYL